MVSLINQQPQPSTVGSQWLGIPGGSSNTESVCLRDGTQEPSIYSACVKIQIPWAHGEEEEISVSRPGRITPSPQTVSAHQYWEWEFMEHVDRLVSQD
jgi:hypothetical protein